MHEDEDFSRFMPQLPEILKESPIEAHCSDMETDNTTELIKAAPILISTEVLEVEVLPSGANAETTECDGAECDEAECINDNGEISKPTTTLVGKVHEFFSQQCVLQYKKKQKQQFFMCC